MLSQSISITISISLSQLEHLVNEYILTLINNNKYNI